MHSTNYRNTLILVSPDTRATAGIAPPKPGTVAHMQYTALVNAPYTQTSDDVFWQIEAERKNLNPADTNLREAFFSVGRPCFRASPLPKTYGWGVHSDDQGRVALVGCDTAAYADLADDENIATTPAMRSRK